MMHHHSATNQSSEEERMQQILDEDARVRKYGDVLPPSSSTSFNSSNAITANRRNRPYRGDEDDATAPSLPHRMSVNFDGSGDDDDHTECTNDDDDRPPNGMLAIVSEKFNVPPRFCPRGPRRASEDTGRASESRRKRRGMASPLVPFVLLSLVLYGLISAVADVSRSFRSFREAKRRESAAKAASSSSSSNRFPGGFRSERSPAAAAAANRGRTKAGSNSAQFSVGAGNADSALATLGGFAFAPSDRNERKQQEEISALTERLLSTTFGDALDLESEARPNEIQFFWTVGGTPGLGPAGRFPAAIAGCFPNVVQAGSGDGGRARVAEEELRGFAKELRVLQRTTTLDDGEEVEGPRYVNVDLFTGAGVRRAADLGLLFPARPYPVVYEGEHDARVVTGSAFASGAEGGTIAASSQIHLMESGFLPETMALFSPPSTWEGNAPPPKARIHALFPPAAMRISLYHRYHKKDFLAGVSYLQFVTSPSIVVNNYVTRILSGQWEEGSPLTEVHLEVAKNVISRKIHLWPVQGAKDMVLNWVDKCGWQEGAMQFHQRLVDEYGVGKNLNDLVLGLDCMFPPNDENEKKPAAAKPQRPQHSELDTEIENIIKKNNGLDEELFKYVMKIYKSWTSTTTIKKV